MKKLMNAAQAARWLGMSPSYLSKARMNGSGPPYLKIGTRVLYDEADLSAWLEAQKRTSTGDADA